MVDIQTELTRVLAPHIAIIRKELTSIWPTLDPELTLLHWLCQRNNVPAPKVSLTRKPESHRLPGYMPAAPKKPPALSRTLDEAGALAATPLAGAAATMPAAPIGESFSLPPLTPRSPMEMPLLAKTAPKSRLRCNDLALRGAITAVDLKTLGHVHSALSEDARSILDRADVVTARGEQVAAVVASMRQELRGKFIQKVPLLSRDVLSYDEQLSLVAKLRPYNVMAGETVVREGDTGDRLYIIEQGVCSIYRSIEGVDKFVVDVCREDFFGEMSAIQGKERTATVIAKTNVTLLSLSHEDLFSTITQESADRMMSAATSRFFGNIPALQTLTVRQKVLITACLRRDVFEPGSTLVHQSCMVSGSARRMFILTDGKCNKLVKTREASGVVKVDKETLHMGAFFGMLAMYYGCPFSATVTAKTRALTLSVSHDDLLDICAHDGEGQAIMASMRDCMKKHLLRELDFLKGVEEPTLDVMLTQSSEVKLKRWETAFRKGDTIDKVFILQEGTACESFIDDMSADLKDSSVTADPNLAYSESITPGTCFGKDVADFGKFVARSTVAATSDSVMLCIPGVTLRQVLARLRASQGGLPGAVPSEVNV
eukprot:TRINITY_DN17217_c0_g1_i1.p1 TRINITY_DN17217_c0_g1~~TRINITY_DN17217_c0_g1_i1.p1  ORF type:complete len:600 (-),score=129.89 TRINITY_DN17217_c0_g1_i1:234-2033(-)